MKNFVVPIISQLNIENYNTSHALTYTDIDRHIYG